MHPFSLTDDVALVTGSSQGIGFAIAQAMRDAGAQVIYHGTRPRPKEIPPDSVYLSGDLRESYAPTEVIHAAFKRVPNINLLICNAGSFYDVPFLEMNRARWRHTLQLNLTANYFLIQEFAKRLVEDKRPGAVVIVSSTSGIRPEHDATAYDITKGALITMTKSIAQALADHHIRVNCVAPGLIQTTLASTRLAAKPECAKLYEKRIPQGRVGMPEDCAGAVVFLCSKAASYITGEIIPIDGGMTVGQIGKM
ncbi:MAG: SDR family oxidoreductase [Verrucomicrobiota bacterium]